MGGVGSLRLQEGTVSGSFLSICQMAVRCSDVSMCVKLPIRPVHSGTAAKGLGSLNRLKPISNLGAVLMTGKVEIGRVG